MKTSLAAAACVLAIASSASAAVYDWTITSLSNPGGGALYDGSGQLTIDDTDISGSGIGAFLITDFEGALNGWEVSLRAPGTYGNDNVLFPEGAVFPDTGPTSSLVGHQGIAFIADGRSWRLYAQSPAPHQVVLEAIDYFAFVDFRIEPVDAPVIPEPATWAMMILGFGAVGGSLRSRRRTGARAQFA